MKNTDFQRVPPGSLVAISNHNSVLASVLTNTPGFKDAKRKRKIIPLL